jgi:Cof subfamily protein (haloacid dehalogenase superfamily)
VSGATDVRAVVTDLDGTMVPEDGIVSDATVRAAADLAGAGIALIAATARTPAGVAALPALTPYLAVAVCCGGAVGWSADDGVVWRETIDATSVRGIVETALERVAGAGIAAHDGDRWRMTEEYITQRPRQRPDVVEIVAAAELAAYPACCLAVCHPDLDSADLVGLLTSTPLDPPPFVTYSDRHLVDIVPGHVDKSTGVARALQSLGLDPTEAIGFGDMPNDLPVFGLVGYAVAVGNAHPEVLAAAAAVTACVHDDGVVRTLHDLGLVRAGRLAAPACRCLDGG